MQQTGPDGLALIKKSEACAKRLPDGRLQAYDDGEGVPTIGWGSIRGVKMGMICDQAQADAMLAEEVAKVDAAMAATITVPLAQHQHDAIASFAFNVGVGWLGIGHKPASFITALNAGNYTGVPAGLMLFSHGANSGKLYPGLVARRKAEGLLWLKDDSWPTHAEVAGQAAPHPRAVSPIDDTIPAPPRPTVIPPPTDGGVIINSDGTLTRLPLPGDRPIPTDSRTGNSLGAMVHIAWVSFLSGITYYAEPYWHPVVKFFHLDDADRVLGFLQADNIHAVRNSIHELQSLVVAASPALGLGVVGLVAALSLRGYMGWRQAVASGRYLSRAEAASAVPASLAGGAGSLGPVGGQ